MSKLFCMGNPLLDISADVKDDCLTKYGLSMNNAILAEEKHMPLYNDLIENYQVQYIAGGATQNSARVCQWMLQEEGATAFSGAVGSDKNGEQLKKCAENDGVAVYYAVNKEVPTGLCACLIKDKERSLCTNLQAANTYKLEDCNSSTIKSAWESASHYYSSGFFLTVSPESAMEVAKHAAANNKTYCLNLAAPFIPQFFTKPLLELIEYSDYIFGNESEAEAIGKALNLTDCSVSAVAKHLQGLKVAEGKKPRTVVITQGSECTVVVNQNGATEYSVDKMDSSKIVDTNGAGDAFVGGFLSQLVNGRDIQSCVEAGHYAAGVIIQVSGTSLEGKPEWNNSKRGKKE